jgi:hypothetical protein
MRTALLTAVLAAILLSLAGCGDGSQTGTSVIPGENGGPAPTPTQPAK